MTFERMCRRNGGYSLPWLLTLTLGAQTVRFVNDVVPRTYGGNTFAASTFEYQPAAQSRGLSGGGTLRIATADANEADSMAALVDAATTVQLEVVGVLLESGTVSEVKTFRHSYGSVRLDGRTAEFAFAADDRLSMTFPALVFSHYNNRGNA